MEACQTISPQHDRLALSPTNCRAHDNSDKALTVSQKRQLLEFLMNSLKNSNTANTRVIFPLSTDHLIPLIQFNVLRAVLTNMALLRVHILPVECGVIPLCHMPLYPVPENIPPQLEATALQKSVEHPPWVDVIPSPTMRDNCIRLAAAIDEDELCSDLIGGLFEGDADLETRGWIVWKDPWDVSGWEATEGFIQKWGFVLKGCRDLLEATNKWRRLRGEKDLVVEI